MRKNFAWDQGEQDELKAMREAVNTHEQRHRKQDHEPPGCLATIFGFGR